MKNIIKLLPAFLLSMISIIAYSQPSVTLCHTAGNACNTITVPATAVNGHLSHGDYLGPCSGGTLYGLRDNGIGVFDFAQFNSLTGLSTTLIPSITTGALRFSSTFDAVNNRYFFVGDRNPSKHFVVDVNNLTFTSTPISNISIEYQYDINDDKIYALKDNGAGLFDFVKLDPTTGNVISVLIPAITSLVASGTSTYDQLNRRYFFVAERNPSKHFVIDVATATFTSTAISGNTTVEYEYDVNNNIIYGLRDNGSGSFDFVEVTPINGSVTSILIPSAVTALARGITTFDPLNKKYFFVGERNPSKHFVIDVNTLTSSSTNISDARIEYEFYSCSLVCPACKQAPDIAEEITSPSIYNYPNPFVDKTHFTYSLSTDGNVTLEIFDITGKSVAKLINDEYYNAGVYEKSWSPENKMPAGLYFYKLKTYTEEFNGKLMIIK
ncbi:MAG: T9SS type A sorting domain-containing protein [Bacteroidetes bacterium]|nr:T9SS type A sorting domain-containing protein [Bacteroidota bacterium]